MATRVTLGRLLPHARGLGFKPRREGFPSEAKKSGVYPLRRRFESCILPNWMSLPISDEALREYCDKNYHQILPIIAEKLHQEKAQQEKLKAVKARLNFKEASRYSESKTPSRRRNLKERLGPKTEAVSESEGSAGGHWKLKPKKQKSNVEDDLSQPWVCEETYPFTPRIHYFDFPKARMPIHIKTYDGSENPEESFKRPPRRNAGQCQLGATCSILHLPKMPGDVKGALECMKISGFMHEITNPELIKRLHDKIYKPMDEMMSVTTTFLRGEVATFNRERKKSFPSWKQQKARQKQNFKRGNFQNEQRTKRKQDRFTLLTKTPKEILALDKWKFKPPPSMTTPVEKRNASKFYKVHGKVGHTTDEYQAKTAKKGKTSWKDKSLAILMVQPWKMIARKRITQTFSSKSVISFPTLGEKDGTKGPMIIEAKMGGHCVHRMYLDEGSSSEIFGEIIWLLGQISLLVKIGEEEHSTSAWMNFMVVGSPSPYNGIIRRPRVAIHLEYLEQTIAIGSTLTEEGRKELCGLLRCHLDVFTWKPTDMTGVLRHVAEHRLNVREGCLPVIQKKKGQAPERNKAIDEEVKKLVEADIMKEIHYHSWLSNQVRVKKHDDNWRMKKEDLIMYLAAAKEAISAVLITKRDGKKMPIYFVSRALQGPEINYTPMEKLILALVNGIYIAKESSMIKYLEKVIKEFSIKQIPRGENKKADALSKITSTSFAHLSKQVLVEELKEKSIDEKEIPAVVEEKGHTWMTPVYEYLTKGILPEEKRKARAVRRKAGRYAVINEVLYKKSFLGPWLRCVGSLQANYVLREIHEGSCSMHAGSRSVVSKALRSCYYWPSMHTDARNLIREYNDYEGIDIAGLFLEGPGKVKFLIVAMDCFTEWIEARPVATIPGAQVKKFIWDNIVCRSNLPGEIVSDNRKQFRDNSFKDWCEKLSICQCFAFVKHPQANGLVERVNKSLREGIKARLGDTNKNWVEEISHVLWAHRAMIKSSNEEIAFSLTYGAEVVIPAKIGMPPLRTADVDMVKNTKPWGSA
nr:reverse transcriptase domain-containing protein [Tanacetum cinerariifolium]